MADRKNYTPEFKAMAVARARAGELQTDITKELGLTAGILSKWVNRTPAAKSKSAKETTRNGGKGNYTEGFKAKVLARVAKGESQADVTRALKLGNGVISYWQKVAAKKRGDAPAKANGAAHANIKDAIYFLKRAEKAALIRAKSTGKSPYEDDVGMNAAQALHALEGRL